MPRQDALRVQSAQACPAKTRLFEVGQFVECTAQEAGRKLGAHILTGFMEPGLPRRFKTERKQQRWREH